MKTSPPRSAETSKSRPPRLSEETQEEVAAREEDLEEKKENANPESVNNRRRKRPSRLLRRELPSKKARPRTRLPLSVRAEEEEPVKVNSDVLF